MKNKLSVRVLSLLFLITVLTTWWFQPAKPVNSQILPTLPLITFFYTPFATATRTPTPISVGNFVWNDLDRDGIQDAGEPGYGGVVVQLWNSSKTQLLDQYTTGANGFYELTASGPGNYRIRAVLPSGLDGFSPKHQGTDATKDSEINPSGSDLGFSDIITFASNLIAITSLDVGVIVYAPPTPTRTQTPISIGNYVWHDLNQNGIQEAGESGVAGVIVQLWNSSQTLLLDQYTTGPSGLYELTALSPGDYRIRFLPPAGSTFTLKDIGIDTADSDVNASGAYLGFTDIYTLASNLISITSIDAGLKVVGASPTPTPLPPGWSKVFLPIIRR